MGCIYSTSNKASKIELENPAEIEQNAKINLEQKRALAQATNTVKLLLLGAGDSGKTTIRKQLRCLYGAGFTLETKQEMVPVIAMVLLDGALEIVGYMDKSGSPLAAAASLEAVKKLEFIRSESMSDPLSLFITPEMALNVTILLKDPEFLTAITKKSEFQLQDCWQTFADRLREYPEWGGASWLPSNDDCIAARVRTSGIQEETLQIESAVFKIFDVGGQRAERRKWINCFEDVTAVIFVAAISEYDQVLFEDRTKNRLEDSFELFADTANNKALKNVSMLVFLNKKDLFEKKFVLQGVPFNVSGSFPAAPTTSDPKVAIQWISETFKSKSLTPGRDVVCHVTSAIDASNMRAVFEVVKLSLLRTALNASGFGGDDLDV